MNNEQKYRRPSGGSGTAGVSRRELTAENRREQHWRTIRAVVAAVGIISLLVLLIGMSRGTAKTGEYVPANIQPKNAAEAAQTLDKAKFAPVCIDPGYGFAEKGMSTGFAEEKYKLDESTVALKFSLGVQSALTSDGYTVIMTHDTNEIPEDEGRGYKLTASERADIANDGGAALLISVHTRDERSTKMGMVVYYREADGSAKLLAEKIAASLDETLTYSETLLSPLNEEEAYNILKKTSAPALLIDIANMSNEEDADRLNDDGWYNEASIAMANGIKSYLAATVADN